MLGERILAPFLTFARTRALVRWHHERLDGSGYPDGLSGSDLDLPTEIVALANAFDILASTRGKDAAFKALQDAAERGEFHRDLVEELLPGVTEKTDPGRPWHELLPLPSGDRPGRILLGDDLVSSREFLRGILEEEGHTVTCVDSAEAVLRAVETDKPDLVMIDLHRQGSNGFELTRTIKSRPETEFLPVILATAQRELADHTDGPRVWADDFLILPINRLELIARVKSLLRIRHYFRDLEEHQSVILSLASALETKDAYTRGHSERVGVLAAQLGRALGLADSECQLLRMAGQLHDIGKIGIPESVLNKEGPARRHRARDGPPAPRPRRADLPAPARPCGGCSSSSATTTNGTTEAATRTACAARRSPSAPASSASPTPTTRITSARSYRQSFTPTQALALLEEEAEIGRWDPRVFATLTSMVRRDTPS